MRQPFGFASFGPAAGVAHELLNKKPVAYEEDAEGESRTQRRRDVFILGTSARTIGAQVVSNYWNANGDQRAAAVPRLVSGIEEPPAQKLAR